MKLNNEVSRLPAEHKLTVNFTTRCTFESVHLSNRIEAMAAHASRVAADLPVSADWQKDESFRTTADCAEEYLPVSVGLKAALREYDIDRQRARNVPESPANSVLKPVRDQIGDVLCNGLMSGAASSDSPFRKRSSVRCSM